MRIQRLELKGFKSFKDFTVISFEQNLTGVVGPNGCGKSNIIDALMWVMGERSSKQMRGSQMSDLIFGGTDNYAPAGFAQVTLVLEKTTQTFPEPYASCNEVSITRRLHTDGNSEYLINDTSARLKDVHELFLDTGARARGVSIIEQGKIGQIVSSKPLERQFLIEEAAGISKFKLRKKESLRKLAETKIHLNRLEDILRQQKRYLSSLEKQAGKAQTYRDLKDKARKSELKLKGYEFLQASLLMKDYKSKIVSLETQVQAFQAQIQTYSNQSESSKLETLSLDKQVAFHREKLENLKNNLNGLEKDILSLEYKIDSEKKAAQLAESQKVQYDADFVKLKDRKKALDSGWASQRQDIQDVQNQWTQFIEKHNELKGDVEQIEAKYSAIRNDLNVVKEEKLKAESTLSSLDQKIDWHQKQMTQGQEILNALTDKKQTFQNQKTNVLTQIEKDKQIQMEFLNDKAILKNTLEDLQKQLELCQTNFQQIDEKIVETKARKEAFEKMLKSKEGLANGIKEILEWQKKSEAQFKLLHNLIVPCVGFEALVGAVLYAYKDWLVCEDVRYMEKALNHLNTLPESQRQSFLIHKSIIKSAKKGISIQVEALKSQGATPLSEMIQEVSSSYKEFIQNLLKPFFHVKDIQTALRLSVIHPECHFVTDSKEVLFDSGLLFVGSGTESVFETRSMIDSLKEQILELEKKAQNFKNEKKQVVTKINKVEQDLEKTQDDEIGQKLSLVHLSKDKEYLTKSLSSLDLELKKHNQKCKFFEEELSRDDSFKKQQQSEVQVFLIRKQQLEQDLLECHNKMSQTHAQLAASDRAKEGLLQKKLEAESQLQHYSSLVADLNERIEKCEFQVTSNKERFDNSQQNIQMMKNDLEEKQKRQPDLIREVEKLSEQVNESSNEWQKSQNSLSDFSLKTSEILKQQSELQIDISHQRGDLQDIEMKAESLKLSIYEKYQVELINFVNNNKTGFQDMSENELQVLRKETQQVLSDLSDLGDVSLTSIYEYDDLKKKYDFLQAQVEDLEKSKIKITRVISQVDAYCSKRFQKTFEVINEKFKVVFPTLFGGGCASLSLVPYEEIGEVGVDIEARPPGKKMQNINLLSGGEKAMTAVSLLFAIFLVNPSPFCLLDEVDAPLDDANLTRFNELVTQMSKYSQIVLITHNKITMSICRKLFGVTMQERGVSKLVSVDLNKGLDLVQKLPESPSAEL